MCVGHVVGDGPAVTEDACEASGGRWERDVDGFYPCCVGFFVFGLVRACCGVGCLKRAARGQAVRQRQRDRGGGGHDHAQRPVCSACARSCALQVVWYCYLQRTITRLQSIPADDWKLPKGN
jgi:hypothetical protein